MLLNKKIYHGGKKRNDKKKKNPFAVSSMWMRERERECVLFHLFFSLMKESKRDDTYSCRFFPLPCHIFFSLFTFPLFCTSFFHLFLVSLLLSSSSPFSKSFKEKKIFIFTEREREQAWKSSRKNSLNCWKQIKRSKIEKTDEVSEQNK